MKYELFYYTILITIKMDNYYDGNRKRLFMSEGLGQTL